MKKRIAFILLCVIFAFTAIFFASCDDSKGGGSNSGGSPGVDMPVIPI